MTSSTLKTLGEFGLIHRVAQRSRAGTPRGVVGVGDDCAAIPGPDGKVRLVTTDLLVQDVHFVLERIGPRDLGHKALAVNLSDVAAMGGTPREAYLSIALPADTAVAWVDGFFDGFLALADQEGVAVLGGDTTGTPGPVVVNVVVVGQAEAGQVRFRGEGLAGDAVCVTGWLGDSAAGLRVVLTPGLLEGREGGDPDLRELVRRHHRPRPHLEEGRWLARQLGVHAMMDVSDGLDADLQRILEASGCGAVVDVDRLPISPLLRRVAHRLGWDPVELACGGGEDYCLLLTVDPSVLDGVQAGFRARFGRPLVVVGTLEGRPGRIQYRIDGAPAVLSGHGFDHFRT